MKTNAIQCNFEDEVQHFQSIAGNCSACNEINNVCVSQKRLKVSSSYQNLCFVTLS